MVRSDYGTENCNLAAVQLAIRSQHDNELAGERFYICTIQAQCGMLL